MANRTLGVGVGVLGSLSAILISAGLVLPGQDIPTAAAQATGTVTTPETNTATVTTTTTTTATATTTTATATTATASPTAIATATQVPPTATATAVPPTQIPPQGTNAPIQITLQGSQEVPPVTTSGTGTFRGTASATTLLYTLNASGMTSNVTAAHIHSGARGVNGPIVANIITSTTGTNSVEISGVVSQANLVGPMAGNMTAFMDALRAGTLYVNVHTVTNPGGELRGQFPAPPGPPATGTGLEQGSGLNSGVVLAAGALAGIGALAFGLGIFGRRRQIVR